MPCGTWWVPGGQTGDGGSAQSRECVAGAPSVQPRLLLVVPLGRADLPGSRIDPTHLGESESEPAALMINLQQQGSLSSLLPGWSQTETNCPGSQLIPQGQLMGADFIGYWVQTYLLGIELWQDILKMSQLIRYMDWDDP